MLICIIDIIRDNRSEPFMSQEGIQVFCIVFFIRNMHPYEYFTIRKICFVSI